MTAKSLNKKWEDLLFDVGRSVRYHNRRRAFFDNFDRFTNVISLMFGSVAIYGVLAAANNTLALVSAAVVTGFSAINLVVGSSQKAREHFDFARQFIELEKMMSGVLEITQESLNDMTHRRLSIEKNEPPILTVLDSICYNEQANAMGFNKNQHVQIGWFQRLVAPFMDFRAHTLHISR